MIYEPYWYPKRGFVRNYIKVRGFCPEGDCPKELCPVTVEDIDRRLTVARQISPMLSSSVGWFAPAASCETFTSMTFKFTNIIGAFRALTLCPVFRNNHTVRNVDKAGYCVPHPRCWLEMWPINSLISNGTMDVDTGSIAQAFICRSSNDDDCQNHRLELGVQPTPQLY